MFVRVDVRNNNARGLNLPNLRRGFGGNFVGVHAAGDRARGECHHAIAEVGRAGERGKLLCAQNRLSVGEHNMAADAKFGNRLCQLCRFCERRTIGHQRRRSHDAVRVSLHDGPVHARSEAKIVRIDNQTAQAASLAGSDRNFPDRNFEDRNFG